jgi:hypothetical protein
MWQPQPLWPGLPPPPHFDDRQLSTPMRAYSTKSQFAWATLHSVKNIEWRSYPYLRSVDEHSAEEVIPSSLQDNGWRYVFASTPVLMQSQDKQQLALQPYVKHLQHKPSSFAKLPDDKQQLPCKSITCLAHISGSPPFASYDNPPCAHGYTIPWCIDGIKPLLGTPSYDDETMRKKGIKNCMGPFKVPANACEGSDNAPFMPLSRPHSPLTPTPPRPPAHRPHATTR